jgi:Cof subfamily protein (haloacid dehalogenase superfamily)
VTASYRLVAVDLDGTLLSSARTIHERDERALRTCVERGIAVAIVTGRRFPAARPYVDALSFAPFVVANSGAIVKDRANGSIIRRRLLPLAKATQVVELAQSAGIEPVVHDGPDAEGHLILREEAREVVHLGRYLNETSPPPRWVPSIELVRDPVQIGFASSVATIRELAARLRVEIDNVSLARTEYPAEELALLDVLAEDANKSASLAFLCDYLSIPLSATIAIGDNWNDVDMLKVAGQGVVMGNADDALKDMGFAETTSNDEAGVARALERFVLEGETKK